ncbi:MAG: peptidylprolyl isomerase [Acetobacteraceae bacterium]|nr:peptidylprolyl isomerase [Acetobacteraceae bacterium]
MMSRVLLFASVLTAAASAPIRHPTYAATAPAAKPPAAKSDAAPESSIVAVVNGDIVSREDVANRGRLFAVSTGLPATPDVLDRLRPQITRQLVDERLRLQEAQRRHVIVTDAQIAAAIHQIEERNGMPPGALQAKLRADGIGPRTLIAQIRAQLAWTQVLRQQLGEGANVAQADVADRQRALQQQTGKPEYHLGEIFVSIEDPANAADAQKFAETIIGQLRAGAPFPVVAAQFSQSQTALQGGDLGWVQPNGLDPEVARIAEAMPAGAVSNPIRVPGGISIITLRGKREIGRDMATMLSLREVFLPFSAPLDPEHPNDQQRQTLEKAKAIGASVHSCDAMEAANKSANSPRPADPGPVRLESVSPPPFRAMLTSLPIGKASQPLVAPDGIAVVVVCSRDEKNLAELSPDELRSQILSERVELASRQLQRDLRRRANIDVRGSSGGA